MKQQKLRCGCCHGMALRCILRTPDRDGSLVAIHHCNRCCALTPEFSRRSPKQTKIQVEFHDSFWADETEADLNGAAEGIRGVIDFYRYLLPPNPNEALIYDIGSGRGNLLAALLKEGYAAFGCEPSDFLRERGIENFRIPRESSSALPAKEFLASRKLEKGKVDAVFFWHVLEHLGDPVSVLKDAAKCLNQSGVIICQGPMLSAPYIYRQHLFFHGQSNIAWLARAINCKIVFFDCVSPERFASFVFAPFSHPLPDISPPISSNFLDAAGDLHNTLDWALRLLRERQSGV